MPKAILIVCEEICYGALGGAVDKFHVEFCMIFRQSILNRHAAPEIQKH
jgi:hypothetical protein